MPGFHLRLEPSFYKAGASNRISPVHDVRIVKMPISALKPGEILVKANVPGFKFQLQTVLGITHNMGGRRGDLSLYY
jgi:hypothetical protein